MTECVIGIIMNYIINITALFRLSVSAYLNNSYKEYKEYKEYKVNRPRWHEHTPSGPYINR